MGKGKTKLKEKWLYNETYKDWLREALLPHHGRCCMCKTDISVENGVENGVEDVLKQHANGKTHKELVAAKKVNVLNLTDIFQSTFELSASLSTNAPCGNDTWSSPDAQSSVFTSNMLHIKNKATRAEIKYALRVVKQHSSFNFWPDLAEFLRDIFSDSPTVSNFTLGKTKYMYLIKFGIASWIREKVMNQVSASPYVSLPFDHSHKSVPEMEQMDLQVRFWYSESNVCKIRCLGSQFQYSTTADDLLEELLRGLTSSPTIDKMTQQGLIYKISAGSIIGEKGHFSEKKKKKKKSTKNFTTPFSIPFLSVLRQSKALDIFHKSGQCPIARRIIGLD